MSQDAWRNIDRFLAAHGVKIGPPTLGQTTGGAHKPNSFHYQGLARDYGRSSSDLPRILEVLRPWAIGPDRVLEELFGLALYIDAGRIFAPAKGLWASHQDHVHVALRAGRTLPLPAGPTHTIEEIRNMVDNPDLPNIEGPLQLIALFDQAGTPTGYYIFSISTGELHAFGAAKYFGRSEDLTPD
jgi:hypothetical protein